MMFWIWWRIDTELLDQNFGVFLDAFLVGICYMEKYPMSKEIQKNLKLVMQELLKQEKYKGSVETKCASLQPAELAAVQKFIA